MKRVFYNKLNRFWLEKTEGLKHEFSQADFVTERDRVDVEIESANAIVAGELTPDLLERAGNVKIILSPTRDQMPCLLISYGNTAVSNFEQPTAEPGITNRHATHTRFC